MSKETNFGFYRIWKVGKIGKTIGMPLSFWSLISGKGDRIQLSKHAFKNIAQAFVFLPFAVNAFKWHVGDGGRVI